MYYEEVLPSPHLQKYVKCFWKLEQQTPTIQNSPESVLPDGCLELVFNLSDKFRRYHFDGAIEIQPRTIIVGQMRRGVTIEPTGKVCLFGVRFYPAGAFPFFNFPLNDITDKIENLDSVWGKAGRNIEERINDAETFEDRIAFIERIFTKQLVEKDVSGEIIGDASKIIFDRHGSISIEALTRKLGVGWRQLERKFQQKMGISPKFFCRIVRLQNVLYSLKKQRTKSLLEIALSSGFYDQAHLIHEFNEFSGKSPLAFLEDEHRISEFFVGN